MAGVNYPTDLKKWQDVFEQQSISDVKVLEKQLRSSIVRDKEKLRILVGGNYRELLTTADEIVALNSRSRQIESEIVDLSSRCKPPELSNPGIHHSQLAEKSAHLHLLSRCNLCATGLVRSHSFLLATQLCLIARLLIKSLGEMEPPPKSLQRLRTQSEAIRQQLISRLDTQLTHPRSSIKSMVEAICAFSLIKSISALDSISHFQDLRLSKLQQRFDSETCSSTHVKESFQYLMSTAQSLRSLLSRGVNDRLASVQRQPILENYQFSHMEALGLGQVHSLIPSDVLTFTPYLKRVVLEKADIDSTVRKWTTEASKVASTGLSAMLSSLKSVREVLDLRSGLLGIMLPVYFSTNAQDVLLESIRSAINDRLLKLCKIQNEQILSITQDMFSLRPNSAEPPSMWDEGFVQRPLVSDSVSFMRQVQNRHLGVQGDLGRSLKKLRSWTKSLKQLQSQVENMRQTRWQDVIEDAEDGDEAAASSVVKLLSETDPVNLQSSMDATIQKAISSLDEQIKKQVEDVSSEQDPSTTQLVFLLRAIRESSAIIGQVAPSPRIQTAEAYARLYDALAVEVSRRLALQTDKLATSASELSPVAENMPSPRTFAALRDLCKIMEEIGGSDIWSAQAVSVVKRRLQEHVLADDQRKSYAQNEFDEQYLKAALDVTAPKSTKTDAVPAAAIAYWDRSKLLFGLLS